MKLKKILAAMTAAAVAVSLTGCFGEDDLDDLGEPSYTTGSGAGDYVENQYDNTGVRFENGATQLSMSSGTLSINRRTRESTQPMGDSGWTILVYLCGTDLESSGYYAATQDIYEAVSAQYSDDVRIVYQTGGTAEWYDNMISNSSVQRYVNTDGDIELVDEVSNANMGDPNTLADFVSWGVENYPAKHMGLVFWNHGGGSIAGVCFDELNSYDSLSLPEIDSALNSVYDQMTDKFEFIGFDACLMSTLETANIIAPYARYMFASEETEPGGGWNYTDIMNFLAENPDADGYQLGEMQCESYYQHCIDNGDSDGSTFAITDLSKLDDLLTSFNITAQEMYEGDMASVARAAYEVDNFGGNSMSEGYTNMIDLAGLLRNIEPYAPNAADTLEKLEAAVVHSKNGPYHDEAGGLSMYYPLSVQGTEELSIFADICTSTYYLAFVDAAAYGSTGGDVSSYDNSGLFADTDDAWSEDYSAADGVGENSGAINSVEDSTTINVSDIYFDDEGIYTVQLADMNTFNYASCTVFAQLDGAMIYLGEDDEVIIDYDSMTLQDNFDGSWPSIDGQALAIQTISSGVISIYTAPIYLNGERTNLRFEFDRNSGEWNIIGAWAGIDPETGAAAREVVKLKDGDVIAPAYYVFADEFGDFISGDDITVSGGLTIDYEELPPADYSYSMCIYDVYGSSFYTTAVTFSYDEDGTVYFDSSELE